MAEVSGEELEQSKVSVVSERNCGRWKCQDTITEVDLELENSPLSSSSVGSNASSGQETQLKSSMILSGPGTPEPSQADSVKPQGDVDIPRRMLIGEECSHEEGKEQSSCPFSNVKESPRTVKSRTTKSEHSGEVVARENMAARRLNASEMMALLAFMIFLLCSNFLQGSNADNENFFHAIRRLLLQGISVAFCTCLIFTGLQGYIASDGCRQWVANIFQLELKHDHEEQQQKVLDEPPEADQREESHTTILEHEEERKLTETPLESNTTSNNNDQSSAQTPDLTADHATTVPPPRDVSDAMAILSLKQPIDEAEPAIQPIKLKIVPQFDPTKQVLKQISRGSNDEPDSMESSCSNTADFVAGEEVKASGSKSEIVQNSVSGKQNKYKQAVQTMYKKFLLIRRKFKTEMASLRRTDHEASAVLSRVQLALPSLEREKQALLAELEAIHKQHAEERMRNHELVTRLQRLNQQFNRIGAPQNAGLSFHQQQLQLRPQLQQQQQQ